MTAVSPEMLDQLSSDIHYLMSSAEAVEDAYDVEDWTALKKHAEKAQLAADGIVKSLEEWA